MHVYRWEPPPDLPAVDALIDAIVGREVDAVTFTSAPAVEGLVHRAEATGRGDELLEALRGGVLACSRRPRDVARRSTGATSPPSRPTGSGWGPWCGGSRSTWRRQVRP